MSLFLLSSTREEVVFNSVAFALRLIDARKPFKSVNRFKSREQERLYQGESTKGKGTNLNIHSVIMLIGDLAVGCLAWWCWAHYKAHVSCKLSPLH